MNIERMKYLAFFLLGFTIWIPLVFLALDLCPYHLVMINSDIGPDWWGWEIDVHFLELAKAGHPALGSYQSYVPLVLLYVSYLLIVALAIILVDRKPHQAELEEVKS